MERGGAAEFAGVRVVVLVVRVVGGRSGTFTWLPRVGRAVYQGQRIYDASGTPVVLLYGSVPSYRDLSEGLTGADVRQLNKDLVKLGYATAAALGPRPGWNYYSAETAYAVEQLQARLDLAETGTLSLGEAVFLPGPALVTGWGTTTMVGAPATPGTVVLTTSSTTPVVTIDLDAGEQGEVKAGDPVSITLPDGSITPGVVSQISRVASSSSSSGSSSGGGSSGNFLWRLAGRLGGHGGHDHGAGHAGPPEGGREAEPGPGDGDDHHRQRARRADGAGGRAAGPDRRRVRGGGDRAGRGHHLVTVTPGLFDDAAGLVQVTGNLTPGQHVVVPGISSTKTQETVAGPALGRAAGWCWSWSR